MKGLKGITDYQVVVLGPRASGKTVYLACLYGQYSKPDGHLILDCEDPGKVVQLTNTYQEVVEALTWPTPNEIGAVDEFHFICTAQTDRQSYRGFGLTYFDYAGERLEKNIAPSVTLEPSQQFRLALTNSDAVVGLIDGADIVDLIQSKGALKTEVDKKYVNILKLVAAYTRNKPVHFLLTKWDLFERNGIELPTVVNSLMQLDEMGDHFRSWKARGIPLRLIPVSAVGKSFAKPIDKGNREMQKTGEPLSQENLIVPIACALYDELRLALEESRDAFVKKLPRFRRGVLKGRPVIEAVKKANVRKYVTPVILGAPIDPFQKGLALGLVYLTEVGKNAACQKLLNSRDFANYIAAEYREGMAYIATDLLDRVGQFDAQFPANRLA